MTKLQYFAVHFLCDTFCHYVQHFYVEWQFSKQQFHVLVLAQYFHCKYLKREVSEVKPLKNIIISLTYFISLLAFAEFITRYLDKFVFSYSSWKCVWPIKDYQFFCNLLKDANILQVQQLSILQEHLIWYCRINWNLQNTNLLVYQLMKTFLGSFRVLDKDGNQHTSKLYHTYDNR